MAQKRNGLFARLLLDRFADNTWVYLTAPSEVLHPAFRVVLPDLCRRCGMLDPQKNIIRSGIDRLRIRALRRNFDHSGPLVGFFLVHLAFHNQFKSNSRSEVPYGCSTL